MGKVEGGVPTKEERGFRGKRRSGCECELIDKMEMEVVRWEKKKKKKALWKEVLEEKYGQGVERWVEGVLHLGRHILHYGGRI